MTWLLIFLALVVAFGPVLWLVPSKRDKRLAAMRSRARSEGLIVEMRRIRKPDPAPEERVSPGGKVREPVLECASYGLPLARGLKYLPSWRLVRRAAPGDPDPFSEWQYDLRPKGEGREFLAQVLPHVETLLAVLPKDVAALEVTGRMVLAFWLEKPGSTEADVPGLARDLRAFADALTGLDQEIEASRNSDDS